MSRPAAHPVTVPVRRDDPPPADAWLAHRRARRAWGSVLVTVLVGPSVIWMLRSGPQPFMHLLSMLTGLLALSAMVIVAVLPSRVRGLSGALGLETLLGLHRRLGVLAGALVALHLACVIADQPARIGLLVPLSAPARGQAATVATVTVVVLIVLALRGVRSGSHEVWRWLHLSLAAVVLGGSCLHVLWLNNLVTDAVMGPVLAGLGLLLIAVLVLRWGMRAAAGEFRVHVVRPESTTVSTLVLARRGRHTGPWFRPGQFAWLRLERMSVEEHPFTIASSATDGGRIEFTVRHTGDFASRLRDLRRGDPVWVDGPYGSFTPDAVPSTGLVLIAGGVGITPMMSMLRTAADRGDPRPYRLVVHARDRADLLFRSELAYLRTMLDLQVTEVLRRPAPDWGGATGPIDTALLAAVLTDIDDERRRLDYFICGRPQLVTDVLTTLSTLGVPEDRVHTEQFAQV
ncbi:putative oxidoreductase [Pseudonocardia sp. Ae168_Ps1]|uniref:ferredoxin reductase family protein n=1 Tax=unclassified Pseudonocardia TaxID=2619320 RepID=UPI0009631CEB|nr:MULTISPECIES: ferric reductase-like transmembrane domain-containing protein [unclassified Pseudonocardia]OLL76532.1 putative oxidoreductase [Pseudonocardia sp. Ae150A_Ps1]OLL82542.1 putative oxidoreductase [Pseudonocardia sp. Ae168_Ps1]OLL83344.1 putative oxidoreductase [Pseudonocardia sp. Ae263_Ps1]OLL90618.1 putative oxidoreductase [Pseudonocardia sp. Ae356_Ps1]